MATWPHHYSSDIKKTVIRVDDCWYDVTAWRNSHPGGAELMDVFHEQDATDAFYSLHSKEAIAKLLKMKGRPVTAADKPRDEISIKFEAFRQQLIKDGWYERNWAVDFFCYMLPCLSLVVFGTYLSYSWPILASLMIGMGMQQAGWIAHDYIHARDNKALPFLVALFCGLITGLSRGWWSHKHNTHHTFPNRKDVDTDIHNEPILHLWFPEPGSDVWYRRYQKYYYPFAFAFLFVSWRMQSIQFAMGSRNWPERMLMFVNYCWLACLPWKVAIASVLIGGFLIAFVVTSNHQTEEILEKDSKYNFIVDQFNTTRGIKCPNFFLDWLFGGMQYQLEHHLFPYMPKHNFHAVRPIMEQFAKENGLQHHVSTVGEIMYLNYQVYEKFSEDKPKAKAQ